MLNYKSQTRGKSQIPNHKFQTNPNIQIQMFKTGSLGFWSLEFGTCLIFSACNLEFVCNLSPTRHSRFGDGAVLEIYRNVCLRHGNFNQFRSDLSEHISTNSYYLLFLSLLITHYSSLCCFTRYIYYLLRGFHLQFIRMDALCYGKFLKKAI